MAPSPITQRHPQDPADFHIQSMSQSRQDLSFVWGGEILVPVRLRYSQGREMELGEDMQGTLLSWPAAQTPCFVWSGLRRQGGLHVSPSGVTARPRANECAPDAGPPTAPHSRKLGHARHPAGLSATAAVR
eukprot:gene3621-biopygen3761